MRRTRKSKEIIRKRDRENSGRMNPNAHSKYIQPKIWINTLAVSDFNKLYSKHKKVTIPCPNQNQCTSLRGAILFIFQVHLKSFNNNLRLSSFASFWQVTHTNLIDTYIWNCKICNSLYIWSTDKNRLLRNKIVKFTKNAFWNHHTCVLFELISAIVAFLSSLSTSRFLLCNTVSLWFFTIYLPSLFAVYHYYIYGPLLTKQKQEKRYNKNTRLTPQPQTHKICL